MKKKEKLCVVVEMNGERRTLYKGDTFTINVPITVDGKSVWSITSPTITVERIGKP